MRKSVIPALIGLLLVVGFVGAQQIDFTPPRVVYDVSGNIVPSSSDSKDMGLSSALWRTTYVTRSIQGSKTKALTESSATDVVQIAIPNGDFADFQIQWTVFASDSTDHQTVTGYTAFSCVNKADTETCTTADIHADLNSVSAGTLTCTETTSAGTNAVMFTLNCVSSLTQTTLDAYVRLALLNSQTLTPQ